MYLLIFIILYTCTDRVIFRTKRPYITANAAIGGTMDKPTKANFGDTKN